MRDFQSVALAELEFPRRATGGGITTIVGPSSSGKSALLRAIRAAARNTGSAPVRAGQKSFQVTLTTDAGDVSLERGPSLSTYKIDRAGAEELYAKSSVTVPDAVVALLGLRQGNPDPHFSFQFDRPYLLSEPGSSVSRIVGELTNANVLAEAVREGARRGLRAKQLSDTRKADVLAAVERLKGFAGLGAREKGLVEARAVLAEATALARVADRVTKLSADWELALAGMEQVRLKIQSIPDVSKLLDQASALSARSGEVARLAAELQRAMGERLEQRGRAEDGVDAAVELEEQYFSMLRAMGRCPICGQDTEHVEEELA